MADRLLLPGPFSPAPRLAVACSGGADSMALAVLAQSWVRAQGGSLIALTVDHGLRAASAAEAAQTVERLGRLGIAARVLTLSGLGRGAAAARHARYAALEAECARQGIVHLLLGHHAGDQAETLQIRVLSGSGADGFAGMAGLQETHGLRRLRPLLSWPPARLRQLLRMQRLDWAEDPSNADPRAQRGRLRRLSAGAGAEALCAAAEAAGAHREKAERSAAAWLGAHAVICPDGYALLPPGAVSEPALAALIRTLSGADYPPAAARVAAWAARPRPATLGGVAIHPAGRLGPGWLLTREAAAIGPPVPVEPGILWDRRFRLVGVATADGAQIGPVAQDAARLRRHSDLPAAVLRSLPAIRRNEMLVAVPQIGYPDPRAAEAWRMQFSPACPAGCAPWFSIPGLESSAASGVRSG